MFQATVGMTSLMSMAPQKAVLEETGETVDVGEVKINNLLAVKAGEIIPIDGIVVEGRSEVDERSLTGESFPVPKQAGSQVWAGTLNIDGMSHHTLHPSKSHMAKSRIIGHRPRYLNVVFLLLGRVFKCEDNSHSGELSCGKNGEASGGSTEQPIKYTAAY